MNGTIFLLLVALGIVSDLALFTLPSDLRVLIWLGFLYIGERKYALGGRSTLLLSLLMIVIGGISYVVSDSTYFLNPEAHPPLSERAAVWAIILFVLGVVQRLKEYYTKNGVHRVHVQNE